MCWGLMKLFSLLVTILGSEGGIDVRELLLVLCTAYER